MLAECTVLTLQGRGWGILPVCTVGGEQRRKGVGTYMVGLVPRAELAMAGLCQPMTARMRLGFRARMIRCNLWGVGVSSVW